jgi:hypothetical protein
MLGQAVSACNRRHCDCGHRSSTSFLSRKESFIIRNELNCIHFIADSFTSSSMFKIATCTDLTMIDGAIHFSHCSILNFSYFLIFINFF